MNQLIATVKAKLTLAFGVFSLLVLLLAGTAVKSLGDANDRFVNYVDGVNARANLAVQVRTAVDRRAIAARNLVLVTTEADLDEEAVLVRKAHQDVQTHLDKLNGAIAAAKDVPQQARQLVVAIDAVEQKYTPVALAIVALALNHQHQQAIDKMNNECRPLLAALVKATDDYAAYTTLRAQHLTQESEAHFASQRGVLIAGCVLAFLIAIASGAMIHRSLNRALGAEPHELGAIAQLVAHGDLRRVAGGDQAAPGSVLASLSAMQVNLARIVDGVRTSTDSIATGASQIASGSADLSQRTEEQASNLQQTAASMEQMTSSVKQNTDTAAQASRLATRASLAAEEGGHVVNEVVATMQGISASSKQIADIIGVIDGIAFQTNILALNAAVEAARAGEQGRGFAVVAGEVRSLAQRSALAAKEIKTLIIDSVEKVELGARQVNNAGQSMSGIVQQIAHVSQFIDEISKATSEQFGGIGQVHDAIFLLDQVTQQNAALVEESAAAAESLRHQVEQLADSVKVFDLSRAQLGATV